MIGWWMKNKRNGLPELSILLFIHGFPSYGASALVAQLPLAPSLSLSISIPINQLWARYRARGYIPYSGRIQEQDFAPLLAGSWAKKHSGERRVILWGII